MTVTVGGGVFEALLANMIPGKTYQVTVSSVKGLEESDPSMDTVTTGAPPPPSPDTSPLFPLDKFLSEIQTKIILTETEESLLKTQISTRWAHTGIWGSTSSWGGVGSLCSNSIFTEGLRSRAGGNDGVLIRRSGPVRQPDCVEVTHCRGG